MTGQDFLLLPPFSLSLVLSLHFYISSGADDELQGEEEETSTCSTHFIIVDLGSLQTLDGSITIVRRC